MHDKILVKYTFSYVCPSNYNTQEYKKSVYLQLPSFLQKGRYIAEVTSSISSSLTAIITSKPVSTSAEVIRAVARLSTDTLNFDDTKNFPILYVYLSKGELRVKRATVEAIVEDPHGIQTCTLNPMDNGVGKY